LPPATSIEEEVEENDPTNTEFEAKYGYERPSFFKLAE